MLDDYKDLRQRLLSVLGRLKAFAEDRRDSKAVEAVEAITLKLDQNRFYLVVLGEFKRGKTTFINALLGKRLLPTGVVPLTSIVTMMKYGREEMAEVHFADGRTKGISLEELAAYVTERGNPNNEKEVRQVEITYPSQYLQDGVYLVDTPGVGSVFSNNTDMTYGFIPKADAALFLIAADPPIGQSEVEFLKDVRQSIRKIFFVQNKVDRLDDEERRESMEFSRGVIEQRLGIQGVEIHPLSAKLALEGKEGGDQDRIHKSFLPRLEEVLGRFLMEEKGREVLRSASGGALRTLSDEEIALEIEAKALDTPLQVLEEKLERFEQEMKIVDQDAFDSRVLFEGEIKRLLQQLDMDLERFKRTEISRMLDGLDTAHAASRKASASDYAEAMETYVHEEVIRGFDGWLERETKKVEEDYSRVAQRFSVRTNEIVDRILEISSGLFDLRLERFQDKESLSSESELYYMVGEPPKFFDLEGALRFLSRSLLPKGISQKMILRDLKKKLPEIIDRNCGRVRADFAKRLQDSFLKFRWDLGLKLEATRDGIESAIQKTIEMKRRSQEEVERKGAELRAQRSLLSEIKSDLLACASTIEALGAGQAHRPVLGLRGAITKDLHDGLAVGGQ